MNKKLTTTDMILLGLEKTVDGFFRVEDFTYNTSFYAKGYERYLKKSTLSKTLQRMRTRGLVELDTDLLLVKLTDKGKAQAVLIKILQDETWDGKWRVVIFDIPEEKRQVRNLLRSRLKIWQFIPWQKSVWATKKNITMPFKEFIKDLGIESWVLILETENGRSS